MIRNWGQSPFFAVMPVLLMVVLFFSPSSIYSKEKLRFLGPGEDHVSNPEGRRINILLILIDALRRDHLGCYGYFRRTSPTIDRLSREGIFFSDVICQSSQTGPSIASLFTGLYPSHHGVQFYSFSQAFHPFERDVPPFLPQKFETLAELFQSQGYSTLGIICNPWIKAENGFGQGFDFYESVPSWDGRKLNEILKTLLSEQTLETPFFAYLHYMDVHAPYYNPESFIGLFTPYKGAHIYDNQYKDIMTKEELDYIGALYDEEIFYADGLIKEVLAELQQNGMSDNTLVVITSDHGEEFFEHQGLAHGTTLYGELINTFFILYNPRLINPGEIEKRVKVIDFYPTLLDIAGMNWDKKGLDGQSLYPLIMRGAPEGEKDQRIFSELGDVKAVLSGEWKYITNPFLKTEELYNLVRDKRELFNRVDKEPQVRRKLKSVLLDFLGGPTEAAGPSGKIPDLDLEKLRALGYLADTSSGSIKIPARFMRPISSRIDILAEDYNPFQLIYGWKKRVHLEKKVYYWIGPRVDFALWKDGKKQKEVVVEGRVELKDFLEKSQRIKLFCERIKLGERVLDKEGLFTVSFKVPPSLGKNRTYKFRLLCDEYFEEEGSKKDKKAKAFSLLVSSIYFK